MIDAPAIPAIEVAAAPEWEMKSVEIVVCDWKVEEVMKKVKSFNRKAAKFGSPEAKIDSMEDTFAVIDGKVVPKVKMAISFGVAKHAGKWNILGSIEPSGAGDDSVILNLKPGVTGDFSAFRFHDMSCDHCGHKRRRNKVVIVEDASDNALYTVGTSCLMSFTGIDPSMALIWEQWVNGSLVSGEEDDAPAGHREVMVEKVDGVANWAASLALIDGYWAKADRFKGTEGSGGLIMDIIYDQNPYNAKHMAEVRAKYAPSEEAKEAAALAVAKFEEVDLATEKSEFVAKVAAIVKAGYVRAKHIKTLAAGIALSVLRAKEAAPKPVAKANEWMGQVGARIEFVASVNRVHFLGEGEYGPRFVISGRDEANREWSWFTGNNDYEAGQVVKVKATIKDLKDDPKWGKSTILTRVAKAK